MKNKKKTKDYSSVRCPYCGGTTRFRAASSVLKNGKSNMLLLVCGGYPACDAYVQCHKGTRIPMGSLANPALRKKRQEAHSLMRQLEKKDVMSKDEIYYFLRKISLDGNCHIGGMSDYACDMVIRELKKILDAADTIAARKAG